MSQPLEFEFAVEGVDHPVGALLLRPEAARAILVFAHGAGAGMTHAFMEAAAEALASQGIATLRYNFPFMEAGRRFPDRPPRLLATVRAAVAEATRVAPGLPIVAGGKSMGGRMTSLAQAEAPLPGVRGLAFFGFPLHPPKKPSIDRADHLSWVQQPMLFLQGTRDTFAPQASLESVIQQLDTARVHWIEGADHSFDVLRSSGRSAEGVLSEATTEFCSWADGVIAAEG